MCWGQTSRRFDRGLDDPAVERRIKQDLASAEVSGARGTPTFFIGERRHIGPYDAESLAVALIGDRDRTVMRLAPIAGL